MAIPSPDVLAIASLLKRERFYRDTAQWDPCRATFHPDAAATYINVAWLVSFLYPVSSLPLTPKLIATRIPRFRYEGDAEDFLRQSAQMHKGQVNIIHSSFDPVDIHVRGDRAISEAFCLVTSAITLGGTDYELASHMRLFTRLEKPSAPPSEWRLLSLESSYVRDRLVPAFPSADASVPPVVTREAQAYPKCYRNLALVMLSRGLKPRPHLAHEDSPESLRRISDRNRAFLDGDKAGWNVSN